MKLYAMYVLYAGVALGMPQVVSEIPDGQVQVRMSPSTGTSSSEKVMGATQSSSTISGFSSGSSSPSYTGPSASVNGGPGTNVNANVPGTSGQSPSTLGLPNVQQTSANPYGNMVPVAAPGNGQTQSPIAGPPQQSGSNGASSSYTSAPADNGEYELEDADNAETGVSKPLATGTGYPQTGTGATQGNVAVVNGRLTYYPLAPAPAPASNITSKSGSLVSNYTPSGNPTTGYVPTKVPEFLEEAVQDVPASSDSTLVAELGFSWLKYATAAIAIHIVV
ncbi:hypothetical protein DFH27DRAFT_640483 [Peziza echinospora]|nr:hypothetical protein DFH27DRAFT_640483 [Peziza echinospora]